MVPKIVYHYILGVDLGRDRDHSAFVAFALVEEKHGAFDHARFYQPMRTILELGFAKRVPLGVEYLKVVNLLRQLVGKLRARHPEPFHQPKIHVVLDSAGPGEVVKELILAARLNINLIPVILTAGHDIGNSSGKRTVPRRDLLAHLRYLLESQSIKVSSNLRLAAILEREAVTVRTRGGQSAHDDVVIAASLGAWYATCLRRDLIVPKNRN